LFNLQEERRFCGKSIRSHCFARECFLFWTFCDARILAFDPTWTADNNFNGRCLKCGSRLKSHYEHRTVDFEICGTSVPTASADIFVLIPQLWIGCPESDSLWI